MRARRRTPATSSNAPWAGLRVLAAALSVAPLVDAKVPEVPIRVDLNGTSDCYSADDFLAEVSARSVHARRARDGELGWSASILVKTVGQRRMARLKLMATEGEWIERELVAPNCPHALDALAVVLAVLVDTAADQSQRSSQSRPSTTAEEPAKPMALPRVATGVFIPWIDDPEFFKNRGISLSASRFITRIAGGPELDTQLAPGPSFGMGLGFEVERWNSNLLRPSFGLSLGWATGDIVTGESNVDVQRWSLRAHLCPFEFFESRILSLRPCGRIEGGYLYANIDSRVQRHGMVRLSPFLRLTLGAAEGAQLRLDGGLDLLAVRSDITTMADGTWRRLHGPPAAGAYAAITVAVDY